MKTHDPSTFSDVAFNLWKKNYNVILSHEQIRLIYEKFTGDNEHSLDIHKQLAGATEIKNEQDKNKA